MHGGDPYRIWNLSEQGSDPTFVACRCNPQVGFTVAAGLVARLASVFSLFDQPMQQAARPVPPHVLQVRASRQLACRLGSRLLRA